MRQIRVRDRAGKIVVRALADLQETDTIIGDGVVIPDGGHVRVQLRAMDGAGAVPRPVLTDAQKAVSAAAVAKAVGDAKPTGRGPMGLSDEDAARLLGHRLAMKAVLSDRWKGKERLAKEAGAAGDAPLSYEQRMVDRWKGTAA